MLVAKQQLGEMATKQICQVKTAGCYNVSGNKTGYKLTFSPPCLCQQTKFKHFHQQSYKQEQS